MWKNKHLPAVTSEKQIDKEGKYSINERREQMLEELEKAHIYIEQLNNRIKELESENKDMKSNQEKILNELNLIKNILQKSNNSKL